MMPERELTDKDWLKRQLSSTAEDVKKLPDWLKTEDRDSMSDDWEPTTRKTSSHRPTMKISV